MRWLQSVREMEELSIKSVKGIEGLHELSNFFHLLAGFIATV